MRYRALKNQIVLKKKKNKAAEVQQHIFIGKFIPCLAKPPSKI
jgi:hypothetical protein